MSDDERKFLKSYIQELIDRYSKAQSRDIKRAEYLLDKHTDSPWEGGCSDCYYRKPCHKAYGYAKIIIKGYEDNAPQTTEEAEQ